LRYSTVEGAGIDEEFITDSSAVSVRNKEKNGKIVITSANEDDVKEPELFQFREDLAHRPVQFLNHIAVEATLAFTQKVFRRADRHMRHRVR